MAHKLNRLRLRAFLNWLVGIDIDPKRVAARLLAAQLPAQISLGEADARQLATAAQGALGAGVSSDAVVKCIFAALSGSDAERAEAVIQAVLAATSRDHLARVVQVAVKTRPRLASHVASAAVRLVPEEAERIARSVAAIVATEPQTSPAPSEKALSSTLVTA